MQGSHAFVRYQGNRRGRAVFRSARQSHLAFFKMVLFSISSGSGAHKRGRPGPVLDGVMRIKGFDETLAHRIAQFSLPELARHLYEYGFKSKREVYQWLWEKSFIPLKDYRNRSWVDYYTNGWRGIEKTSGKPWRELPDDYMVPTGGNEPFANCIIVAGGQEEMCQEVNSGHGHCYSIDSWR